MTALTSQIHPELTIRGRAERTQRAYTRYVSELARYYQRSPELITYEEVTDWLYHLIKERQLSASSVNFACFPVRFNPLPPCENSLTGALFGCRGPTYRRPRTGTLRYLPTSDD